MSNASMLGFEVPDLASNVGNYFSARDANITTEQRIDRQNAYTKEREDTAVSRRAYDLSQAGFNRILAAGGDAAGSSSGGFSTAQQASLASSGGSVAPKTHAESKIEELNRNYLASTAASARYQAMIDQSKVEPARQLGLFYGQHPNLNVVKDVLGGSSALSQSSGALGTLLKLMPK